mmetsp:Transcript_28033/g.42392  ORF Transcript_28033/g.42392 Transcript_28033/m.42392 type:complete len:148 (-) Transcript_28033:542-985(-)
MQVAVVEFVKPWVWEIYPKSKVNWPSELFQEFMEKFGIMFRDMCIRLLMNLTRQRRHYKRYFEDCNILMGEATYIDEKMYEYSSKQMTFENSVCLTMAINVYFYGKVQFLKKALDLDLICPAELQEHAMYTSYAFEMVQINRQQLIN